MKSLRERILVDKLKDAAKSRDSNELKIIREIIKGIKLYQIENKVVASDQVVMEVIRNLAKQYRKDQEILARHLREAIKFIDANSA